MWKIYTALLGYLAIETYRDIKERQISVRNTLFLTSIMIIWHLGKGASAGTLAGELLFLAEALVPGTALLLLGLITGQAIGYGDGMLLLAGGFCVGGKTAGLLLLTGLFLLFPLSLVLLLAGRVQRNTQLPFAPFLLAAYLLWLLQAEG